MTHPNQQWLASEWTGLDGSGCAGCSSTDVYQTGVDNWLVGLPDDDGTYDNLQISLVWYEWYPNDLQYFMGNAPVGDTLICESWWEQVDEYPFGPGFLGCVDLNNPSLSANGAWVVQLAKISNTEGASFVGDSAEWIVEKPGPAGSITFDISGSGPEQFSFSSSYLPRYPPLNVTGSFYYVSPPTWTSPMSTSNLNDSAKGNGHGEVIDMQDPSTTEVLAGGAYPGGAALQFVWYGSGSGVAGPGP